MTSRDWATLAATRDDVIELNPFHELKENGVVRTGELSTTTFSQLLIQIARGTSSTQRVGDVVELYDLAGCWEVKSQSDTGYTAWAFAIVLDTMPKTGAGAIATWSDVFGSEGPHSFSKGTPDARCRFVVIHHEMGFVSGKIGGGNVIPARIKKFNLDMSQYHTRYLSGSTAGTHGNILDGEVIIMGCGDTATGLNMCADFKLQANWRYKDAYIPGRRA